MRSHTVHLPEGFTRRRSPTAVAGRIIAVMSRRCALLLVAIVLSACGAGDPSPVSSTTISPGPSSVPSASAQPTGEEPTATAHSPVVQTPAGILPPDSVARVVAVGLRVRDGKPGSPGHDDVSYSLAVGDLVLIGQDPLSYLPPESSPDGRGWYAVHVGGPSVNSYADGGINGWVAEGEKGLEFLEAQPVICPGPATLKALLAPPDTFDLWTTAWEQLACHGGEGLELEGVIETPCYEGAETPLDYQPSFLASPDICSGRAFVVDEIDADGHHSSLALELRFPPEFGAWPERGELVSVRGHFDDPASSTCSVKTQPDYDFVVAYDPEFVVLGCRERFVVDELMVIGHRDLAPLPWEQPSG